MLLERPPQVSTVQPLQRWVLARSDSSASVPTAPWHTLELWAFTRCKPVMWCNIGGSRHTPYEANTCTGNGTATEEAGLAANTRPPSHAPGREQNFCKAVSLPVVLRKLQGDVKILPTEPCQVRKVTPQGCQSRHVQESWRVFIHLELLSCLHDCQAIQV